MHEEQIRITHPEPQDIPAMERIWMDAFGDSPELIEAFFDRFPPDHHGWIVRRGAEILSTAYLILGNHLLHGGQVQAAAYVYAVATPEEHRGKGYGAMLMRHFAKTAEERDLLLYTRPASNSLFHWYAETMQTVPAAPMSQRLISAQEAGDLPSVKKITAAAYGKTREDHLFDQPHIRMSEPFLTLQEAYLEAENGGYFRIQDGICACEVHEDTLVIKEILAPGDEEKAIQALLHHFQVSNGTLFVPSASGNAHVAYRGAAQSNTVWGLLLD